MLTKWGKKVAACAKANQYGLPIVSVSTTSPAFIEAKSLGGTTLYIPPIYYTSPVWTSIVSALVESGLNSSVGVAFGSDGTAPTENDYTIRNLVTGIVTTTPTIVTDFDTVNNRYIARLDYAISNDTGSAVTIAEIGLFVRFSTSTTRGDNAQTGASYRYSFMMDRTILDTPITIANGDAAVVRYEFAYEG